jgi:hypothetical protein
MILVNGVVLKTTPFFYAAAGNQLLVAGYQVSVYPLTFSFILA